MGNRERRIEQARAALETAEAEVRRAERDLAEAQQRARAAYRFLMHAEDSGDVSSSGSQEEDKRK